MATKINTVYFHERVVMHKRNNKIKTVLQSIHGSISCVRFFLLLILQRPDRNWLTIVVVCFMLDLTYLVRKSINNSSGDTTPFTKCTNIFSYRTFATKNFNNFRSTLWLFNDFLYSFTLTVYLSMLDWIQFVIIYCGHTWT